MTKQEFENIIEKKVSEEDYAIIEYVYCFYPTISETNGKRQIADLYLAGGMPVIKDMKPRAKEAEKLENQILTKNAELKAAKYRLEELRK